MYKVLRCHSITQLKMHDKCQWLCPVQNFLPLRAKIETTNQTDMFVVGIKMMCHLINIEKKNHRLIETGQTHTTLTKMNSFRGGKTILGKDAGTQMH